MHDAGIGFRSGVRDVRGRYWKDRLGAARCANPRLVGGRSVQPDQFSARQIEALENEQWADLPSGVSLRGLIRNYARLLGADSQAIVESLDPAERVTGPVKLSPGALHSAHSIPQSGADDERSSSASWGWLIAIVLVLAAGVAMRSGRAGCPSIGWRSTGSPSCPSKPGFPDARILSALPGCAASRCGPRRAAPRVQWT